MDRYILFAGDRYYPRGGWNDCCGTYTTLLDAVKGAAQAKADWWHIVDLQEQRQVADHYQFPVDTTD